MASRSPGERAASGPTSFNAGPGHISSHTAVPQLMLTVVTGVRSSIVQKLRVPIHRSATADSPEARFEEAWVEWHPLGLTPNNAVG